MKKPAKVGEPGAGGEPALRLFLWPHRLLVIGPAFDTALHRHHAVQLCVGLSGPLRLRPSRDAPWLTAWGFFVPPDTAHQLDAGASRTAFLYLEPESSEYAAHRHTLGGANATRIRPLAETAARRRWANEVACVSSCQNALTLARELLENPPSKAPPEQLDERVCRALLWIGDHLSEPIRLRAVARAAAASESHLAHLFRAQVGLPLRRYVLWRRLRVAVEQATSGQTLTASAHEAGFADAAHLSRTFRDMFGVTPSAAFLGAGGFTAELCKGDDPAEFVLLGGATAPCLHADGLRAADRGDVPDGDRGARSTRRHPGSSA